MLFKILVQEAAAHLPKPTIWNIKRAMRDEAFVKKIYAPVLEYKAYLEGLAFLGLNIVDVTGTQMFAAPDIGADQALLIADAAHVAIMHGLNMHHLATDDVIYRTFQTSSSGHRSDPWVVPAPSQNFSP